MKRLLLAVLAFATVAASASVSAAPAGRDAAAARTDALLTEIVKPGEPGVMVGVWHGGKVIYRGTRGLASMEQDRPLTPDTRIHIASLSKAMTGLAVMRLADAGRVDLDADIHRYLPGLPNFGAPVPVGAMLHMQSGLKDYFVLARLAGWDWADGLPPGAGAGLCPPGRRARLRARHGVRLFQYQIISSSPRWSDRSAASPLQRRWTRRCLRPSA